MRQQIDLNCDLGEGCAHDLALIPLISSANIACGLHAGDPSTMQRTVRACLQHGVAIGAHPGFADREHFGRREQSLTGDALNALLHYQLGALQAIVRSEGGQMHHVKPHGALYNQSARDPDLAQQIAIAIKAFDPSLQLVGLAGSASISQARAVGLQAIEEGFVERRYQADGQLLPRQHAGAQIEQVEQSLEQLQHLLQGRLRADSGEHLPLQVDTLCLHGDRPDVLAFAQAIRETLDRQGIKVKACGARP